MNVLDGVAPPNPWEEEARKSLRWRPVWSMKWDSRGMESLPLYEIVIAEGWNGSEIQTPSEITSVTTDRGSYMICIFVVGHELYSYNDSCRVESFNTLEWNVSWRHSWYLKISRLHMVPQNQWVWRKYSCCWNIEEYKFLCGTQIQI